MDLRVVKMLKRSALLFLALTAAQSVRADPGATHIAMSPPPDVDVRNVQRSPPEDGEMILRQDRDFDILALPLEQAALAFSDQARMQLLMDPAIVSGIRSAPLKGRYAIDHALDLLLLNTPLQWRRVGAHTVTIEPASQQVTNLLGPLRIESAGNGAASFNERAAWEDAVLRRMERAKSYPVAARRAGMEDTVYVRVWIDRAGKVLESGIVRSRGFTILDQAVLDLMKRVDPLPPPPRFEGGRGLSFVVPIEFVLRRS